MSALTTHRTELFTRLASGTHYDLAVIGGGATGLGVALDAAARGYRVVLLESDDFGKGTSSRSTKLVHGGVRYLAQGNIALVKEALHERSTLLNNAGHLAAPLAFVVPSYKRWQTPYYGIGLKLYDLLAGKRGLGKTQILSAAQTIAALPNAQPQNLTGGVLYWDGQFNDTKLCLAIARTAAQQGALLLNYCRATELIYQAGNINGVRCRDTETEQDYTVTAGCVVNATGVWVDQLVQQDSPQTPTMVAPSQGVHIVVDASFLQSDNALMIPSTSDGRVLFAVPWLGKVILGTTDTPRSDLAREPLAFEHEIEFILKEAAHYLHKAPKRADVLSIWVGLRPLVKASATNKTSNTKSLSREHTIVTTDSGLVTVTGGKWTTYRAMAEDVLQECIAKKLLLPKGRSVTSQMKLIGAQALTGATRPMHLYANEQSYGDESHLLNQLTGNNHYLVPGLSEAMVRFAVKYEYARTIEDVLARRSRLLFLDAKLALRIARQVGDIIFSETQTDPKLSEFTRLAQHYQLS